MNKLKIRDAVERVHVATIYATELINIHIRRCFEELGGNGLESVCDANWLLNVYGHMEQGGAQARQGAACRLYLKQWVHRQVGLCL